MKKLKYGMVFLALVGIGIVSCEKEEMTTSTQNNHSPLLMKNDIPKFDSQEELYEKLDFLNQMGEAERRSYEKANGYKSLLTTVYEVYEGIDMESLTSRTELEDYIAMNASFLCIKSDYDREEIYTAYYADNYYAALANSDRMLIVGDICIKVFDDGIASTHVDNLDQLLGLNGVFVKDLVSDEQISISVYEKGDGSERAACDIVHNEKNSPDNGDDRTKLVVHSSKDKSGGYTTLWTEGYVRPYKKTLGIWYYAQRTCTAHIKYEAAYEKSGTTHSINRM